MRGELISWVLGFTGKTAWREVRMSAEIAPPDPALGRGKRNSLRGFRSLFEKESEQLEPSLAVTLGTCSVKHSRDP